MTNQEIFQRILDFVKLKHGQQVRKYTGEPYWVHPLQVALMVKTISFIHDMNARQGLLLQLVALCHDLYEDTDCTSAELSHELGCCDLTDDEIDYVLAGVSFLTDHFTPENYPQYNRAKRKQLEAQRLSTGNIYTIVKMCDMMDNSPSIVQFGQGFAHQYLREKRMLLDYIYQVDYRITPIVDTLESAYEQLRALEKSLNA